MVITKFLFLLFSLACKTRSDEVAKPVKTCAQRVKECRERKKRNESPEEALQRKLEETRRLKAIRLKQKNERSLDPVKKSAHTTAERLRKKSTEMRSV